MARRPKLIRRLAVTAVWPAGIALTSWHYLWRTTPLHRRERPGSPEVDSPPPLAPDAGRSRLQTADDGVGPLYHRCYRGRIRGSRLSPEELIARIGADPNRVTPNEFARFTKLAGLDGRMQVGDEYVVRMPGPWDGPVRVVEVTPTSFRLATLEGHLEAGQIEFAAKSESGLVVFSIESWARSGDPVSKLLHHHLRMAKEVQLHMWTSFLERVVHLSGGTMVGGLDIDTRRVDGDAESRRRRMSEPHAREILDGLHAKGLNFDAGDRRGFTAEWGWKVDDYCQPLPPEAPGPPAPGGSWEVGRRLLRNYEFADPRIVRAVYHPDRPLEDRDMLLEARFYGLRFHLGVRVGGVLDELREVHGRPVQVWGWNYRTLQGHLEMGQMDYEVWKWLDTGAVEFHTRRFSRHAPVGNPVVRLGLRLFGRHQQEKFARRACERMASLTSDALGRPDSDHRLSRVADEVQVIAAPPPS